MGQPAGELFPPAPGYGELTLKHHMSVQFFSVDHINEHLECNAFADHCSRTLLVKSLGYLFHCPPLSSC